MKKMAMKLTSDVCPMKFRWLAIAFGFGGQDLARQFLERRLVRQKKEEKEDELSPL